MGQDNKNNVIQFPKIKKSEPKNTGKVSFALEQKKVMISASLFSLVFAFSVFNNQLLSKVDKSVHQSKEMRGIASVGGEKRDTEWEHRLAKKLAHYNIRTTASVGQNPSDIQKLRYETLQGNYIVRIGETGKLKEIVFMDYAKDNSQPKLVTDRHGFVMNNKSVLPEFDEALLLGENPTNTGEVFELKKGNNKVATVDFRLDRYGHMLQMSVTPNTKY